jgi:hypothetical protein
LLKIRNFIIANRSFILLSIVIFGMLCRLERFAEMRTFNNDECALISNFFTPGFQFLQPLEHQQSAPIVFIFLSFFMGKCLGFSEMSLRIWPLLFSIGSLILMYVVIKQEIKSTFLQAIGLGIFACSNHLIDFAGQCKQYSSEVFFTLLAFVIGQQAAKLPLTIKNSFLLGFGGFVLIFASHSALFLLFSFGLALVLNHIKHLKQYFIPLSILFTTWIIALALMLKLTASAHTTAYMQSYWKKEFAPLPLSKSALDWYTNTTNHLSTYLLSLEHSMGLVLVLFIAGIAVLVKHKRYILLAWAASLAIVIFVSIAHFYPIKSRMMLWALPIILIVVFIALDELKMRYKNTALLIALFIFIRSGWSAAYNITHNANNPQITLALKDIVANNALPLYADKELDETIWCYNTMNNIGIDTSKIIFFRIRNYPSQPNFAQNKTRALLMFTDTAPHCEASYNEVIELIKQQKPNCYTKRYGNLFLARYN